MEFRLLGPVAVTDGERAADLGSPRQRAVLAMLALAAPHVVSTDRLVDGLWGEQPPARPLPALQVFMHGLRKALRQLTAEETIQTVAPGYRLAVPAEAVDVNRFAALHRRARAARERGETAAAVAALAEALALWGGAALADVLTTPFAEPEAVRLEEMRLLALEDHHDGRLALGQHQALLSELDRAVHEHPMRERFWGQLMTALYRSDRQADALATYTQARERLADELGIDPSQALQQLEVAILRQDPSLAAPATPPAPGAGVPPGVAAGVSPGVPPGVPPGTQPPLRAVAPRDPTVVPAVTTPTFGREALVGRVRRLVTDPAVRVVTLTGPGGSGKSRVAVLVAAVVRDEGDRSVAYLTATERTDASQLAREAALALTGSDDVDGLATLPAATVLVLDNLESLPDPADVVGALVGGLVERAPMLTVLATSRVPLRIRAEHDVAVPPLEVPAEGAGEDELAAAPAVRMYVERAGAVSPAARAGEQLADVVALCRFVDGLPLAIELAAAQSRLLPPARILAAIEEDLGVLEARASDIPERQRTLAAVIQWSYDQLDERARVVADRLALFERGFTVEAVEAVCDDVPDVLGALAQIVEARLVRAVESRVEVRFVVLGTVRSFARSRLAQQPGVEDRRAALVRHLLGRAWQWAGRLDGPEGPTVLGRFDDSAADLDASFDWAVERGRLDVAVALALPLTDLWVGSGRLGEGLGRVERLLAAEGLRAQGTAQWRADLHLCAGRLAYHLTRWEDAQRHCRAVLEASRSSAVSAATVNAATCYLGAALVVTGAADEGAALAATALEEAERADRYPLAAVALSVLAISRAIAGDVAGERRYHERRLEVVSARGDLARLADTLNTLAEIALDDADASTARSYAAESLAIAGTALPLEARDATITLARAAAVDGDAAGVAEQLRAALALADRTGQSLASAQCLRVGGCLAGLLGRDDLAVRAFSAAHQLSPSPSGRDEPIEQDLAAALAAARTRLGEAAYRREWLLGRSLPLSSARAQVEALTDAREPVPAR